jgi:hypothetical protein
MGSTDLLACARAAAATSCARGREDEISSTVLISP